MKIIGLSLFSLLLSYGLTAWLISSLSHNFLDQPNQRSSHYVPTLRGGGLGFVCAFAITDLIFYLQSNQIRNSDVIQFIPLWLTLIPLIIIGFLDDWHSISASTRYFVQLGCATTALACFGTFPIPWLGEEGLLGQVLVILLSAIAITAIINFYNFMDGLDGLVASVTTTQLAFIAIYLHESSLWLLVSALIGFLLWNWFPAKIFMGDVGSTVLGCTVAIALLESNNNTIYFWSALTATFPLLFDATYTLINRILKKENIFRPHRTHIYQRLQQSGLSHQTVSLIYILMTLICVSIIYLSGVWSFLFNGILIIISIFGAEWYLKTRHL